MKILSWPQTEDRELARQKLREIFFATSSRREFADIGEKDRFFSAWTAYYFNFAPQWIFFAFENGEWLGYLTGCADSAAAGAEISPLISSYTVFADLFDRFPAHLHINVAPGMQKRGVGSALISHFIGRLREKRVRGVHIVTSPDAANTVFYRRMGFDFEEERSFSQHRLLFMGRSLEK